MDLETYERREKHNVSEGTLSTRLSVLNSFSERVSGEPAVEDLEEYIDDLIEQYEQGEFKASTVNEYYKCVKRYYKLVLDKEDEVEHIAEWIPSNDSDPGEYLRPAELSEFRDALRGFRNQAMIDVMYFFARRPREVLLLNDEDIDEEENTITFNILKKKDERNTVELETEGGEVFKVFRATFEYPPAKVNSLQEWMQYKPDVEHTVTLDGEEMDVHPTFSSESGRISYSTVYNTIKQATKRAGIDKNITPKSLRHSRITHLDHAGKTPDEIARHQALHSPNSDVIGRYIHEQDEQDVRDVMTIDEE